MEPTPTAAEPPLTSRHGKWPTRKGSGGAAHAGSVVAMANRKGRTYGPMRTTVPETSGSGFTAPKIKMASNLKSPYPTLARGQRARRSFPGSRRDAGTLLVASLLPSTTALSRTCSKQHPCSSGTEVRKHRTFAEVGSCCSLRLGGQRTARWHGEHCTPCTPCTPCRGEAVPAAQQQQHSHRLESSCQKVY